MTDTLSPLDHGDRLVRDAIRRAEQQLSEAEALYAQAGTLEARALWVEPEVPGLALAMRALAAGHRETAKSLSHEATLTQLQESIR